MKKILFFAAFLLLAGLNVTAQNETKKSCDKPCTHSEKASADATNDVSTAVLAAEKAENIEVKTCDKSGNVSFYRKDVCEQSGKVSYTEVEYMESTGEFAVKAENAEVPTDVTPTEKTSKAKSSCSSSSASKSGCCSSKSGTASKAKSSCSSSPANSKSGCCSSKSAKKS